MIVIDASAALELLFRTPAGGRIAERIANTGTSLQVDIEIDLVLPFAQVLRSGNAEMRRTVG